LQVELVKLQRHSIDSDDKILIILEGRDAADKDGTIKRIVRHLSPRETRAVALGKTSRRERKTCYSQRFVPHLPATQELVLFNRSCKYYLDVSKHEQKKRLKNRVNNPLRQWKVSRIDSHAIKYWKR
jgi:polyphosphate kinase 2 (PPK2 family)